ncbi:hypothetical protein [Natronococcus occultus]|uniref:hypothetical protein n=1 Tax=Natronococcus occultus TaxID=29288 RepID=UPI001FE18519|nr:hypothetical protein [Natronococcus occultus]
MIEIDGDTENGAVGDDADGRDGPPREVDRANGDRGDGGDDERNDRVVDRIDKCSPTVAHALQQLNGP